MADFLRTLRKSATLLVLLTISGAVVGITASTLLPKRWQAVVLVEIGHIGRFSLARDHHEVVSTPVESLSRAAARIRNPSFLYELIKSPELNSTNKASNDLKAFSVHSIEVAIPRGTDLLEMRASSNTREGAIRAAMGAVALLKREHAKIFDSYVASMKTQQQQLMSELTMRVQEKEVLEKNFTRNSRSTSTQGSTDALFAVLISLKDSEIRSLRASKQRMDELLSPARTFETAAVTEIYAGEHPVFPKLSQFALAGGGIGLIVAIGWILYRRGRSPAT